jgi:hypothetical protein
VIRPNVDDVNEVAGELKVTRFIALNASNRVSSRYRSVKRKKRTSAAFIVMFPGPLGCGQRVQEESSRRRDASHAKTSKIDMEPPAAIRISDLQASENYIRFFSSETEPPDGLFSRARQLKDQILQDERSSPSSPASPWAKAAPTHSATKP